MFPADLCHEEWMKTVKPSLAYDETKDFIRARANHSGDSQDKGELGGGRSVHAQKQRAENSDTRTGRAGNSG